MLHTVTKDTVGLVEGKPELVAEASELGLAPGVWPDFIAVVDDDGEGFLFERSYMRAGGSWCYRTKDGLVSLLVFND